MTPLLCVAARYGSTSAKAAASRIHLATCLPSSPKSDKAIDPIPYALRWSVKLLRIRKPTRPPVIRSSSGLIDSTTVLIAFAPIASRVSNKICTINIFPIGVSSNLRNSMLRAPPPRLTILPPASFASTKRWVLWASIFPIALDRSGRSSSWICPIMMGSSLWVTNPNPSRNSLAALLTAAMTDGSSTAIGMR